MSSTFYGNNGKTFSRHVNSGEFLAKITFGLWDKIGCHPKSEEDCKLVARILKNRIHLNQYYRDYWLEIYGVKEETDNEAIKFLEKLAKFFDECGGCMNEGDYYEKYGSEATESE